MHSGLFKAAIIFSLFSLILFSTNSFARNHIKITGSSTLYPFTTVIAEEFGDITEFKTPIVEATGTGGGMKLFCSGIGENYPDLVNASRRIKDSEIERCRENNISLPVEIKIGYDGIVLANSVEGKAAAFTKEQIFLALASEVPNDKGQLIKNPYQKWSDIDKALPNIEIAIYGPPPTSGTRDAFVELIMEGACTKTKEFIEKYPDKEKRNKVCQVIRSDGKFIEAGENDNLIVQKLKNNKEAFGVFGFSFLQQNSGVIQGVKINNVDPTFDSITKGQYEVSRPLFIYFKKEHLNQVPGMKEFIKEIVSEDTMGPEGYLAQRGLITMTNKEFLEVRSKIMATLN